MKIAVPSDKIAFAVSHRKDISNSSGSLKPDFQKEFMVLAFWKSIKMNFLHYLRIPLLSLLCLLDDFAQRLVSFYILEIKLFFYFSDILSTPLTF